jgi:hypothetical protein
MSEAVDAAEIFQTASKTAINRLRKVVLVAICVHRLSIRHSSSAERPAERPVGHTPETELQGKSVPELQDIVHKLVCTV